MSATERGQSNYERLLAIERAPLSMPVAEHIGATIDTIISIGHRGISGMRDDEKFEQHFAINGMFFSPNVEDGPVTLHFDLTNVIHDDPEVDETYDMYIEWRVPRGDIGDNGFTRHYHLMIGQDSAEDPKLLVEYLPPLISDRRGGLVDIGTVDSSYAECDHLLMNTYYRLRSAGAFEAGYLLRDLVTVKTLATVHAGIE